MQTLVIIQIFIDLLIKRKVTRSYLSEKYEMSTRTITRYVDVLSQAGVPIESITGLGGGYVLPSNYKLERQLFSKEELVRIRSTLSQTSAEFADDLNEKILEKL
ncbi:MAG: HTH domain-containing protein [Firmicutes bacterium]|nr:HTH domain-containing protein [Bacillota bacterium]